MVLSALHSWMRLVKRSNTEVSGASEVPQSRPAAVFYSKIDLAPQNVCRSRTKGQAITSTCGLDVLCRHTKK